MFIFVDYKDDAEMSRVLFLFTDFYPYEPYEPYIENEADFLFTTFDNIYIFSQTAVKIPLHHLPKHVKSFNRPIKVRFLSKVSALFFTNFRLFLDEKDFIHNVLKSKFTLNKKRIFLMEYRKARRFSRPVFNLIKKEESNNNLIFIYSYWNDYKAIAAALLKERFPFVKAFSRAHGWDVYFERNTENYLPLKRFMSKELDKIFYVSENGLQYTARKLVNCKKMQVSRLGISNSTSFAEIKKTETLTIASCSIFSPIKRIELIIEALSIIPPHIKIKWIHFGDGPKYEDLLAQSKNLLGSKKNIEYVFNGFIQNRDLLNNYLKRNINLFINVSSTEGLPLTIIEAMSFGIPAIGTDVGGVSEIIEHGINGILLPANPTPQEVVKAIDHFHNMEDEEYRNYCSNAYQTWFTKFNAEKNYPAFINEMLA